MAERGWAVTTLANKLAEAGHETSYEHIRRIVRGSNPPSRYLLNAICDLLGLDFAEVTEVSHLDRAHRVIPDSVLEKLTGKPADMELMERLWVRMDDKQKLTLTTVAQSLLSQSTS